MILILRLISIGCVAATLGVCGTWSGLLVDAKFYSSMLNNRSDMPSWVNWDRASAVEYCSPTRKTHAFGIVQNDGWFYRLDPAGNEKAIELVKSLDRRCVHLVSVSGINTERQRNIDVAGISVVKQIHM